MAAVGVVISVMDIAGLHACPRLATTGAACSRSKGLLRIIVRTPTPPLVAASRLAHRPSTSRLFLSLSSDAVIFIMPSVLFRSADARGKARGVGEYSQCWKGRAEPGVRLGGEHARCFRMNED